MAGSQHSYRWKNDDGNESAATFAAATNTGIDAAIGAIIRPRFLLDTVGTFSGGAMTTELLFKKTTDSIWKKVDAAASTAISFQSIQIRTVATASPCSVNLPGSQLSGRTLAVIVIALKPTTANGGSVTTPSGWDLVGAGVLGGGYGGTIGADTGNMKVLVYTRELQGNDTTPVDFAFSDCNVVIGRCYTVQATTAATWSVAIASGEDTSGDATWSVTCGSDPGVQAGDHVAMVAAIPTDLPGTANVWSAQAITQTGITFGTVNEREDFGTSSGNDMGYMIAEALVSSGTSSAAPVMTATVAGTTTNARGPGVFIRVRATNAQDFVSTVSAHLASSGNTTAQMTAPAGKTSGADFVAGRYSEVGGDLGPFSVAADKYTEVEHSISAAASATVGATYHFRIVDSAEAFTYTQQPEVTIIDPNAATGNIGFMM